MGRPRGRARGSGRGGSSRGGGRPRRGSDSTVESIDETNVRFIPESEILKDTKIPDSDAWPTFVLKDAVVYRKSKTDGQLEIANLCNVDLEGPFVVRGRLEIDLDEHSNHYHRIYNEPAYIEIPISVMYSIGYGPWPVAWVGGRAGWFEINPAQEYAQMFEDVCEGITLYYTLMDIYTEAMESYIKTKQYKALQMPIDTLLFKYAVALGDGVTLAEAKQRCQKHALFLLAHLPRESEFKWHLTSFHKWLNDDQPELVKKLAHAKSKSAIPPSKASDSVKALNKPDGASSTESDRNRRKQSRASRLSQDTDVEMKDAPPSMARPSPLQRVETPIFPPKPRLLAPAPIAAPKPPSRIATPVQPRPQGEVPSGPGAVPYQRPSTPVMPGTPDVDLANAPKDVILQHIMTLLNEIVQEQNTDCSTVKDNTITSRLYFKCTMKYGVARDVMAFYAKDLVASLPPAWHSSPFYKWLKAQSKKPWSSELVTAEAVPSVLVRRKTKPRGPVAARKPPTHTSTSGKYYPGTPRASGGLRPGPAPGEKRPLSLDGEDDDDDDDDEQESSRHPAVKQQRIENDSTESDDNETDSDVVIDDSSDAREKSRNGSISKASALPKDTVRLVVRSEKIPTMVPQGPNGTWKCAEAGCSYIVRSAEQPEGKQLIEAHFEDHSTRYKDQMDLALTEGALGNLPIKHLVEKIRAMGERLQNNQDTTFPEPIKKRLPF